MALWLGAAIAVASAGAASAQVFGQPYGQGYGYGGRQGAITLWSEPGFRGDSRTIYGSDHELGRIDFNDRARSIQASGPVVICEDNEFRGRCERINGSVPDLGYLGLAGRVSSVMVDDGRGRPGGGYGYPDDPWNDRDDRPGYDRPGYGGGYGAPQRDGVEGRSASFFVRPSIGGRPLAARGQSSADQFCRASGYRGAIYYSQGERVRGAIDTDGRSTDAPVLQDVLCRR